MDVHTGMQAIYSVTGMCTDVSDLYMCKYVACAHEFQVHVHASELHCVLSWVCIGVSAYPV